VTGDDRDSDNATLPGPATLGSLAPSAGDPAGEPVRPGTAIGLEGGR
jgi:hypothetical protein